MTRLLCALLCLGLGTAFAQTLTYETPSASQHTTLTPNNVLWAAYRLDPHADEQRRAHDFLRVREPQRHASNMHDQAALDAEAAVVAGEIKEQIGKIDPAMRYVLELEGVADSVEDNRVHISSLLNVGIYDVETSFGSNSRYLPPLYELLLANAEHFSTLTVNRSVGLELSELLRQIGPQTAYLQVELELVKLQQGHRFQTIVRNVKWFRDPARTALQSEKSDNRSAAKLIKSRMLSEGVTFESSPEHAYTVSDERIMEVLIENHPRKERTCKEQPREAGHRVFLCQWDRQFVNGMPSRTTFRYVGGRLADVQIFYIGTEAVTEEGLRNIWHVAQYEHMGPSAPSAEGVTEWSYGGARFFYDPAQVSKVGASKPYYRATALRYLDLKAGKPDTQVVP